MCGTSDRGAWYLAEMINLEWRKVFVAVAVVLGTSCTGTSTCNTCAQEDGGVGAAGGEAGGGSAGGGSAGGGSAGGGSVGGVGGGAATLPAWRRALALNAWAEIPGTSGAAGATVDPWGALAENKATAELYIAASGGHSDGSDNRVVSISLMDDAPTWTVRRASSTNPVADVLYYPDGLPTSRHLYHHLHYLPASNRVLLGGCRFGYGGGTPTGPGMDAFDLTTNQWLPRNTFADITPFNGYVVEIDGAGAAWTTGGLRFVPSTNTWSKPGNGPGLGRFPQATAAARNIVFSLQFGDGQGYDLNLGVVARRLDITTGNSVAISFTASPALTQFMTSQPNYAGMDFDAANDRFLFYHGGETGTVYVITPNATTTWDMSILTTTGMPTATPTSGA